MFVISDITKTSTIITSLYLNTIIKTYLYYLKAELPIFLAGMMFDIKWGNNNTETEEIKRTFFVKDGVPELGRFK